MSTVRDPIRFSGRILFLTEDPDLVEAQLAGRSLDLDVARTLRNDISTDEITPVTVMLTYDEQLGRYPYIGFEARGRRPIGVDDVRRGGFEVTVAGGRYGKGSSRESSPLAELHAGIRLIIAESRWTSGRRSPTWSPSWADFRESSRRTRTPWRS